MRIGFILLFTLYVFLISDSYGAVHLADNKTKTENMSDIPFGIATAWIVLLINMILPCTVYETSRGEFQKMLSF